MEFLVTGATGFVGGEVARQLVRRQRKVRAVVRDPAKAAALAALGVELFRGDVSDKESMRAAMSGVDGVFHLAGWYKVGVKDTSAAAPVNVGGTRNVLELMRELGVKKGVYTSTLAVFGDTHGALADETHRHGGPWLSVYDRTKWQAHYEVAEPMMEAGLSLVIVLPGVVYGPGDTSSVGAAFNDYLDGTLRAVPRGAAYCWGHVEDTARAHLLAMESGRAGQSYIIAGDPLQLTQAFDLASEATGVPPPRFHPGPGTMRFFSRMAGLAGDRARQENFRVLAGVTYLGTNAKARRELGFNPRPARSGLVQHLAAMAVARGIKAGPPVA